MDWGIENLLKRKELWYCWWKKSCSSWYAKDPRIAGFHTSQMVQDFSHQQHESRRKNCSSNIRWKYDVKIQQRFYRFSLNEIMKKGETVLCWWQRWNLHLFRVWSAPLSLAPIHSDPLLRWKILSVDFVSLTWKSHSLCLLLPFCGITPNAERFGIGFWVMFEAAYFQPRDKNELKKVSLVCCTNRPRLGISPFDDILTLTFDIYVDSWSSPHAIKPTLLVPCGNALGPQITGFIAQSLCQLPRQGARGAQQVTWALELGPKVLMPFVSFPSAVFDGFCFHWVRIPRSAGSTLDTQ